MESQIKRVSKACDICRGRKLKCDGLAPKCTRCALANVECVYSERQRRRQKKRAQPNGGVPHANPSTLTGLDVRMERLESMLSSLIGKLNSEKILALPKPPSSTYTPKSPGSFEHDSENTDSSEPERQSEEQPQREPVEKYFGAQTTFSVLSSKGIQWLEKFSGDPKLLSKFQDFHKKAASVFLVVNSMWMDPIDKSELRPLPPRSVVNRLLDKFHSDLCIVQLFLSKEEIVDLFDRYYELADTTIPKSKRKRLTNSDFLCINAILVICCMISWDPDETQDPALMSLLQKVEKDSRDNAIFYFHRVSTISEGLRTVQALMMMVIFSGFTQSGTQSYSLVSTVVRFAQEMGLHRRESLIGLPEHEAMQRRRLWICAYIFDRDSCFRSGKPPIIQTSDVSSVNLEDYRDVIFYDVPKTTVDMMLDPDFDVFGMLQNMTLHEYQTGAAKNLILYYSAHMVDFTSLSYEKLFSANSLKDMSLDEVLHTIVTLDRELERKMAMLPKIIRPGVDQSELLQGINVRAIRYGLNLTHLQYYSSKMIINKVAFTKSWMNSDHSQPMLEDWDNIPVLQKQLMKNCLDSARMIMRFVSQEDHMNSLLSNHASFQFMSAFFTLFTGIIEYPMAPFVQPDLEMITNVRNKLLAQHAVHCDKAENLFMYNLINYCIRFFMRVAVMVYNKANPEKSMDMTVLNTELKFFDQELSKMSALSNAKLRTVDPLSIVLKSAAMTSTTIPQPIPKGAAPYDPMGLVGDERRGSNLPMMMNPTIPSTIPTDTMGQLQNNALAPGLGELSPGQMPDGLGLASDLRMDEFTMEEFEMEKNSSILQQIFSIPSVFLNANEMENYGMDGILNS